ncbi:cytochrome aa3 quinol oxidase subunit II [Corticicoccus populi]|uniref:Quinol oxidase subunit 2 n=1 Tax=Corticicoccus populi TaxID=1812821 RepID=A0ABW5WSV7_9STAP
MKKYFYKNNKFRIIFTALIITLLSGCEKMDVLNPIGPVGESQRDLIYYSLYFMAGIIIVVFSVFTYVVIKYRANRKNRTDNDYAPDMHGKTWVEVTWFILPVIIVTALSIPTVQTLYQLEEPPESSNDEEPLVIYATSADWKWIFSYPEENIETVNHLYLPAERPVEFRLSSADSMASMWIPQIGGQKYSMAGMQNTQYLQADETGTYLGRNANFTGEGFTAQTFQVKVVTDTEFDGWVEDADASPELTKEKYDKILEPGLSEEMTFSSTHLDWVDHGKNEFRDYSVEQHEEKYGEELELKNVPGWNPNEIRE